MKTRLARDEDYAATARLTRQTIRQINSKDYPEDIIHVWSARTSAQKFREREKLCKRWVAIEDDKVVGYCDHNFECELWGLYVHKDYQGKGIGSRLLEVAEGSLKKQGCKKISIKSTITAREFYESNGYKVLKKAIHKIEDKKVQIFIMEKKL